MSVVYLIYVKPSVPRQAVQNIRSKYYGESCELWERAARNRERSRPLCRPRPARLDVCSFFTCSATCRQKRVAGKNCSKGIDIRALSDLAKPLLM